MARINLKKVEVTEKEVDVARAQERAAQAALELAEIQLRNTELRSSFKGVVTSRNVEPGEVVTILLDLGINIGVNNDAQIKIKTTGGNTFASTIIVGQGLL